MDGRNVGLFGYQPLPRGKKIVSWFKPKYDESCGDVISLKCRVESGQKTEPINSEIPFCNLRMQILACLFYHIELSKYEIANANYYVWNLQPTHIHSIHNKRIQSCFYWNWNEYYTLTTAETTFSHNQFSGRTTMNIESKGLFYFYCNVALCLKNSFRDSTWTYDYFNKTKFKLRTLSYQFRCNIDILEVRLYKLPVYKCNIYLHSNYSNFSKLTCISAYHNPLLYNLLYACASIVYVYICHG